MVDADARDRLVTAVRAALEAHPTADPAGAERLACLLVGRERFTAAVGEPPRGRLAALPDPFDGLTLPSAVEAALDGCRDPKMPGAIGEGYEATVDADSRGTRGQFFTPEPVAEALVRWALGPAQDGPPRVLDPAVGTGTFLLATYRRLRARRAGHEPAVLLDHLVGVDIDAAALHLAGLRLAATAGVATPESLALHHASFFDCRPTDGSDGDDRAVPIEPVDAVVGNPPYVRAEDLHPDADHFRRHLAAFGPPDATPLLDGPHAVSRRSDAYVYFVTHATRFLRPGGRLAMVLPTKWLMSDYGRGLRQFLRDRYRVHAVVGFGARAFGDALVDTALLLAELDDSAGAAAPLRLVQVDSPAAAAGLSDATGTATTRRTQTALTEPGSLARYLEAPAELVSLFRDPAFVRLDELAEVARGTVTGANRFFFVDDEAVERFGIEPRFRRPGVKSLRSIDRPAFAAADVERQLVDVHGYVADVRPTVGDGTGEAAVKRSLATEGHDGLLAYVEHAEAAGWHAGPTCQSRAVWFDLGPLRAPAAFVPKLLRERVFAVRNAAGAVPSNAIDGIWPREGVDPAALLAVLNASVGAAAMEVTGRDEAGLLQLMTYETASLPTLDVRACSPADRRALAEAGGAYADRPDVATRAGIDAAVDAAFDLPIPAATLGEHASALKRRRVSGGETVAVPRD